MKKPERKRSYPSVQAIDPREITRIRVSMGLTQAELAERLNINERTISSAENGNRITEAYAIALARGLGRPPAELFAFPDHKLAKQPSLKDQGLGELANEVLTSSGAVPDSGKEASGKGSIKPTPVILDSPNWQPPIYLILSKIILLAGALLIINWIGERTSLGKRIKLTTYGLLQHRLTSKSRDSDLPIVVVDISNSSPLSSGENNLPYSSRSALQELVAAAEGSGARAVGVDIDFSPDKDGYISPSDPDFFQFCLRAKEITGAPIYLGIYRSRFMLPSAWLGEERYKELAATIIGASDNRRMVRWLQTIDSPQRSFSMSASLAGAVNDSAYEPHYGLGWAIQAESDFKDLYFSGKEFWIDYGPLAAFEKHVIRATNASVIRKQSEQLRGKIVLLGDITGSRTRDMLAIPIRRDPVPGALIHACATYTLLSKPLYSLTVLGRMALDFIISFVMIGGILFIQMRFEKGVRLIALHILFALLLTTIITFIGWGLVDKSRFMWDDFPLVTFVLLSYVPVEHGFRRLKHAISKVRQRRLQTVEGQR